MESPKLTCVAGLSMLLLSLGVTATAQQNALWKSKLCKEHVGSCGILVTFNPPLGDVLLVPNEVTVDVPLELGKVSQVVVVAAIWEPRWGMCPQKVLSQCIALTKSAITHGSLARSGNVLIKEVSPWMFSSRGLSATQCRRGSEGLSNANQSCATDTGCPSGQRCGFPLGCESKGKCIVPSGKTWCNPANHCGCDGRPVNVFCGAGSATGEYTSAPATVDPCP